MESVAEGKVLEKDTTLTAYFKANEKFPEAHNYLYQDFPNHFVWVRSKKKWKIWEQKVPLVECTMLIQPQANSSIFAPFSQL
jgi:hypothetical protein